eukprot:CAMPEP_0115463794 /NCGR_PEP_ID=MMETSP0271-20121206/48542_1 /TAXON_ID=71861 /ORGANISM="Scrippsiella trochoidea, Strain CCMP3099" /LENGTH=97 /DNA_ID=CAMNT_0002890661 /DNA_START=419 /DNA_END=713 /DNA_ORIENTATION=+
MALAAEQLARVLRGKEVGKHMPELFKEVVALKKSIPHLHDHRVASHVDNGPRRIFGGTSPGAAEGESFPEERRAPEGVGLLRAQPEAGGDCGLMICP